MAKSKFRQELEAKLAAEAAAAERRAQREMMASRRAEHHFVQMPGGRPKRVSNYFGGDQSRSVHFDMDDLAYRRKFRHAEPIPPVDEAWADAKGFGQEIPIPERLLAAYCDGSKVVLTEVTPFGKERSVVKLDRPPMAHALSQIKEIATIKPQSHRLVAILHRHTGERIAAITVDRQAVWFDSTGNTQAVA